MTLIKLGLHCIQWYD